MIAVWRRVVGWLWPDDRPHWQTVADRLEMKLYDGDDGIVIEGNLHGRVVRVRESSEGPVMHVWGMDLGLDLETGSGARGMHVGDKRFDNSVVVAGDETVALALLTPTVRQVLRQNRFMVKQGTLTVMLPEPVQDDVIQRWAAFSKRLSTEGVDEALEERLRSEPQRDVRARLVDLVGRRGLHHLIREHIHDADLEVRFAAAHHLRNEEVLAELFAQPRFWKRVLASLEQHKMAKALLEATTATVRSKRADLYPHCIRASLTANADVAELAREVLSHPRKDWDDASRTWSCHALGRQGAVGDVETLLVFAERGPLQIGMTSLQEAAEDAIARIQSRIDGERGGLSVLAPSEEQGQLSLPAVQDGELAVVDVDAGEAAALHDG